MTTQPDPHSAEVEPRVVGGRVPDYIDEEIEGLESTSDESLWKDYPIDTLHINTENRSIFRGIASDKEWPIYIGPRFSARFHLAY